MKIGIDPGGSGAIAVLWNAGGAQSWAIKNLTELEIFQTLQELKRRSDNSVVPDISALIEAVASRPGQGAPGMFKFGMSYGSLRMALIAAGIPFEAVAPNVWKKKVGLVRKKNESLTAYKNRSKARAQELFPQLTCTHANSEALLLAWWGGRR